MNSFPIETFVPYPDDNCDHVDCWEAWLDRDGTREEKYDEPAHLYQETDMNTIDLIIAVLTSPKAHMIGSELAHRLVARLALLEPMYDGHPSQVLAQKKAKVQARECINSGGEFGWFAEYAEQYGLYGADVRLGIV